MTCFGPGSSLRVSKILGAEGAGGFVRSATGTELDMVVGWVRPKLSEEPVLGTTLKGPVSSKPNQHQTNGPRQAHRCPSY